jgi:hypothetical protein
MYINVTKKKNTNIKNNKKKIWVKKLVNFFFSFFHLRKIQRPKIYFFYMFPMFVSRDLKTVQNLTPKFSHCHEFKKSISK